ncbi:hypothetical protein [Flavobacterium sp.]|uniref:hypothetical protein n=1 Tax=Flavobacterium sp. TaxID=239 RepID=UPI0037510944
MKIKLFTLIIVLCVCFCNCVLKKNQYKIIDKVLDSDSSIECDSTNVILETSKFDSDFFKNYENYKLKVINTNFHDHHPFITWLDKKNKWLLSKDDINYMLKNKNGILKLDKNVLKTTKVINLVNLPLYRDDIEKNKDVTKQIINCNYLYQFSKPIFNKNKNKAVIMKTYFSQNYKNFYIFIKEKEDWIMVGRSNNYSE